MKSMASKMVRGIRSGQGKDQIEVELPWSQEETKKKDTQKKKPKKSKKKKSDL